MSIEITGPAAFDRQYRITVLLALIGLENGSAQSLRVEAKRGEDAELTYSALFGPHTLEIQVKTEEADLDWPTLARFLAHFEPRSLEHCTLSRLATDIHRSFLLVYSGRAVDALRRFLAPLELLQISSPSALPASAPAALGDGLRSA
jgi:hypothetical protein